MSCTGVRVSGPPVGHPTQLKVLVFTMPACSRLRPCLEPSLAASCSTSWLAAGNLGSPKTPSRCALIVSLQAVRGYEHGRQG